MINAALELEVWDNVFMLRDEPRSGLVGVPQALVGSIADHSLIEFVRRALQATGYPELRNLGVRVNDYCVTLDGSVHSYYLKQLAQSAAARVPGIVRIVNAVEVVNCR